MRRLVVLLFFLAACGPAPMLAEPGSVCEEAQLMLLDCGAALGVLGTDRCHGPSRLIAECVVDRAGTCERLASITFDQCVNEAGERLAPDTEEESK